MFVSLIHGVRRPYHLTPTRQWMIDFADYLRAHGICDVYSFAWSGALFRAIRGTDARIYADELMTQYRAARERGGSLSIVAKSLGAVIAERALKLVEREIEIDQFLRIGVPDSRTALRLTNVSCIVDVTSSADRLRKFGLWFIPHLLPNDGAPNAKTITPIALTGLSHGALTEETQLAGGGTTYELYLRLLRGEPHMMRRKR